MTNADFGRIGSRAIQLIRRNPVLWLPVVWAAVLSYGWAVLRKILPLTAAYRVMTLRAGESHSVLGGSGGTYYHGPILTALAYLTSVLISFACQYADVCCYFVALMMTVKMLSRDTDQRLFRLLSKQLFGYSFLCCLLVAAGYALTLLPFARVLTAGRSSLLTNLSLALFQTAVVLGLLSYFVTPLALKLVARSGGRSVSAAELSIARMWALLASGAVLALSAVAILTPKPWNPSFAENVALSLFWSVLTSLPYAPLFVALGLMVTGESSNEGDMSTATVVQG